MFNIKEVHPANDVMERSIRIERSHEIKEKRVLFSAVAIVFKFFAGGKALPND